MDFSVIVMLYNAEEAALKRTLASILLQKDVSCEIILADDASRNDCLRQAETYLTDRHVPFRVSHHAENQGTVQNLLDAAEMAKGTYVKDIGAGDLLFDEHTLSFLKRKLDENPSAVMGYGLLDSFQIRDGKIHQIVSRDPADIRAHITGNERRIRRDILQYHGWISGAAMFFRRENFIEGLQDLQGTVLYCEDQMQAFFLLKNQKILFVRTPVVYYEVGTGISTGQDMAARDRLNQDRLHYWKKKSVEYPNSREVKRSLELTFLEQIHRTFIRRIRVLMEFPGELTMVIRQHLDRNLYRIARKGCLEEVERKRAEEEQPS